MILAKPASRAVPCLFLISLAWITAPAHAADWLEASSDHFVIYSDGSEESLRKYATQLERFHVGLRKLFIAEGVEEDAGRRSNRLRIYLLKDDRAVGRLHSGSGRSMVSGFYLPRIGGSVAFSPRRTVGGGYDPQDVLLHEYVHHFMYANFSGVYPRWLSEGFAELGSTARFEKDGGLSFGIPASHRARILMQQRMLDMDELLDTPTRPKLNALEIETIYGRGWLLTHYLIFSRERRGQLNAYLKALNEGTPSVEAGKTAFGNLAKLDQEIDRYKSKPIPYLPIAAADLPVGPIALRQLSPGESAMMPIQIRSTRGVNHEEALELLPEARKVAARYPDDPQVQAHLAEAEHDADNLDEADAAADRALAADPRNVKALLYKGRIAMDRARKAEATDDQTWKAVRSWFVKANAIDHDAAEALYLFYTSYRLAGLTPTDNAVEALYRAYELSPEDRGLRLDVAFQALRSNRAGLARNALVPIAYDPHENPWRDAAAAAIDLIMEGKTAEASEALMRPPNADAGDQPSEP